MSQFRTNSFQTIVMMLCIFLGNSCIEEEAKKEVMKEETTVIVEQKYTIETKKNKNIEIQNKITKGETIWKILKKYNARDSEILLIAEQEEVDCNFNKMQTGKEYKVALRSDSSILSFHYQATSNTVYTITFTDPLSYSKSENTLQNVKSENIIEKTKETLEVIKNDIISEKEFLTGRFQLNNHPDFVLVDKKYHTKSEMYLQKVTLEAFINMSVAAKKDGINLIIISGTRNYYSQKSIWERKYNKYKSEELTDVEIIKKIMIWSSMPSTSRHHWGTDIDINGFEEYFDGKNEKSNKEYEWLVNNAHKFGFCQVYTEKGEGKRQTGYNEEKWHWSYMPLSSDYLKKYKDIITYTDINGFSASEFAKELDIIKEFVFGIGKGCN